MGLRCKASRSERATPRNSCLLMFFGFRTMLEQALESYEDNPYYRNECARTKFMLGTIQVGHGDPIVGQSNINAAKEMYKEIKRTEELEGLTEEDFDGLIMPWSR
jgi:hypothetical protein